MAAFAAVWLVGSAALAQPQQAQPQRDPFNGRFGATELAPRPAEALQLANLMTQSLASLRPERRRKVDTYVIVASLWNDPVFEREATQAEAILREHFDLPEGRSIVLSAGAQGQPRRYPQATPTNIAAAIGRVGELINRDEDMVILFFTSHGSPDGSMALRESERMLGVMRPMHLRDSLLEAGIRNRVVIVSACFSGAFVQPLMSETTVVLTAAAQDRTSFGCQPENEWTFFGDAYFNHGIRGGASMLTAFDQAAVLIDRWERERNLTPPSNPQKYIGARAAALLAEAERGG
jgi:hypothetical protein